MCKIHSCECFNSSLCSKWLSFFYSGNLALANSLWVNLELSITCLLGLTQRLPATSKHMSIGIPLPACLAVVERRPRSLNHVCSELQSSFIILMECTHEVVSLHPMLSNSYLLSSCFWVFCAFEVLIAFRHAICLSSQWDILLVILMALLGCFFFFKKKKRLHSEYTLPSLFFSITKDRKWGNFGIQTWVGTGLILNPSVKQLSLIVPKKCALQ